MVSEKDEIVVTPMEGGVVKIDIQDSLFENPDFMLRLEIFIGNIKAGKTLVTGGGRTVICQNEFSNEVVRAIETIHKDLLEGEKKEDSTEKMRQLIMDDFVSKFTVLFYILMRDDITVGRANEILKQIISDDKNTYSDEILQRKAESLAAMLYRNEYLVTELESDFTMPEMEVDDDTE